MLSAFCHTPNWKIRCGNWLRHAMRSTPPTTPVPLVWYAGLAAEPEEFSQQLAALDTSVQRHVQKPVHQKKDAPSGVMT
jgi:hypothetical protein